MKSLKPWIIAALAAALTLSVISVASAQPTPPSTFRGTVTSPDGEVAAGLTVEAFVGETNCTDSSIDTFSNSPGVTEYFVTVHNSSTQAGCGGEGAEIRFVIGGQAAVETATRGRRALETLNLTFAPEQRIATVHVAVWRNVANPAQLYLSTRPEGGAWTTHNDVLDMSLLSDSGNFHRSNLKEVDVELADGSIATVHVAVWRNVANPAQLYLSTRPEGGAWTTHNDVLDMSLLSDSGNFHRSNLKEVDVEIQ